MEKSSWRQWEGSGQRAAVSPPNGLSAPRDIDFPVCADWPCVCI